MIIDFHVHTFPDAVAPKAIAKLAATSGITPTTDGTVASTLAHMKASGIGRSVILNIATRPGQEHTIMETARDVNSAHPELVAFGSVHPFGPDALENLEKVRKMGLPGIKLHPDYQGFYVGRDLDSPISTIDRETGEKIPEKHTMREFFALAEELGIFISFHSGFDHISPNDMHCTPEGARTLADTFPRLRMCFAHFGAMLCWDRVYETLIGPENVYVDTAMAATGRMDPELAAKIVRKAPKGHVLLGSDCPWENPVDSVNFVQKLPLSDSEIAGILGENATKLISTL